MVYHSMLERRVGLPVVSALLVTSGLAACSASPHTPATSLHVELTDDGCRVTPSVVRAGALTIVVHGPRPSAVTEVEVAAGDRVLAEAAALAQGTTRTLSLRLGGGHYAIVCPGSRRTTVPFRVTGKPLPMTLDRRSAPFLRAGAKEYAEWVRGQTAALVTATSRLVEAVTAGHVGLARRRYAAARVHYERIEAVAETFTDHGTNLDMRIDERINDVPAGRFGGFHRIEQGLFAADSTRGLAAVARRLDHDVRRLRVLTANASYQPTQLANGAVALLDEVESTKVTGEEERYSHLDILDITANVAGVQQAFVKVQAGLQLLDTGLASTVAGRFATLDALLATYRDSAALGGVVPLTRLKRAQVRQLSNTVLAVIAPLSQVAGVLAKVAP
jgi:iron uptake system component EfeO